MAIEYIKAKMYQRRDTTQNWLKYNPILASGEFGYDINEKKYKIGDGVSHWNQLDFAYLGEVTDKNGDILKYKEIATEDFVKKEITSSIFFAQTKNEFPSIGGINKIYVELDTNNVYTWDSSNLTYKIIGSEATLPEETLKPLVTNVVEAILVDKLTEDVPKIVNETLENSILDAGNSIIKE